MQSCGPLPNNSAILSSDVCNDFTPSEVDHGVACLTTFISDNLAYWLTNSNIVLPDGDIGTHGVYQERKVLNGSVLQTGKSFGNDHEGVYQCFVEDEKGMTQLLLIGVYAVIKGLFFGLFFFFYSYLLFPISLYLFFFFKIFYCNSCITLILSIFLHTYMQTHLRQ